ncbi:MAG: cystathionine beta-lyase [Alphaproteobacteria bacterium]
MKEDTKIAHAGRHPFDNHGVVNPPVYHASTILHPTVAAMEESRKAFTTGAKVTVYGRRGTPTSYAFEEAVAALEQAADAVVLPSGLAAITAAMLAFLKAGDHVLMVDSVYTPSRRFCDGFLARFGVETTYYDPTIGGGIADLMRDTTRIVYTESPGSQTFEVQDIPAIARAAHAGGAKVLMDNTWASPVFFKPYDHGVDVSIHAATKYMVGHSDAMLGVVTAATTEDALKVRNAASELGFSTGPDDIYLGLRGLRTIGVRLRQHHTSGIALARWLAARPEVARVLHPALEDFPTHALWKRDFSGASGLFGVVLKPCSKDAVAAMLDGLKLYGMGASWGGYESLILPTHPEASRSATTWATDGPCLRIHCGLEDMEDLTADLDAGFARLRASDRQPG